MILTISTDFQPTDILGFLLHKHPDKVQQFSITGGDAWVFYPEHSPERSTASLLLDLDPVGMVRTMQAPNAASALKQYVNDRPYVASSFMSHALSKVYASAMNGKCPNHPEWPELPIPLTITLSAVKVFGGKDVVEKVFAPLGYEVAFEPYPLEASFAALGNSLYGALTLRHTLPLQQALSHLYVLLPVFDYDKHYYVGSGELDKLMEKGEGWLKNHPEKELITKRYLRYLPALTKRALEQMSEEEEAVAEEVAVEAEAVQPAEEAQKQISLHNRRLDEVALRLKEAGATSVLDMGCGEGKLLRRLMKEPQFKRITGVDVASKSLEMAADNLHLNRLPEYQRQRISLLQGSVTYRDSRLTGFDAAAMVEVIEHLEPYRLEALAQTMFGHIRPTTVVLTTPNVEYNVRYGMAEGKLRHGDHRFEWSRAEFAAWGDRVAATHGYTVAYFPLGDEDPELGAPSQMAIFTLPHPTETHA